DFCFDRVGHPPAPVGAYSGFLAISPRRTLSCPWAAKQGFDQPDFGDETAKRYSAALSLAISACAAIRSMRRVELRVMSASRPNSLIFCAPFSGNRGWWPGLAWVYSLRARAVRSSRARGAPASARRQF